MEMLNRTTNRLKYTHNLGKNYGKIYKNSNRPRYDSGSLLKL